MNSKLLSETEQHYLFPSGEWEGFYTNAQGRDATQHPMTFVLNFKKNIVTGIGNDDIGSFSFRGEYDPKNYTFYVHKYYISHSAIYQGHVDENGIWGMWSTSDSDRGGFHVWPRE